MVGIIEFVVAILFKVNIPNVPNAPNLYKIYCLNVFKSKQFYTHNTRTLRYSRHMMVPKSPQRLELFCKRL